MDLRPTDKINTDGLGNVPKKADAPPDHNVYSP